MQQTMISSGDSGQNDDPEMDDIERELSCSTREACLGFVPFANLDFTRISKKMADQGLDKQGRGPVSSRSPLWLSNLKEARGSG
jgi:hypothetical protein